MMDAIAAEVEAAGWGLVRCEDVASALLNKRATARRVWVVGEVDQLWGTVESVRWSHPHLDLVLILPPGSGMIDRCRALELGCRAVLTPPLFSREVLAWCRAVWRTRAFPGSVPARRKDGQNEGQGGAPHFTRSPGFVDV